MARFVLRGARVVDGSGAPAVEASVVVADGFIESVGGGPVEHDLPVVDLEGLVLAPGFIDPHTHYDAQVLWDADLTPSSWHGVTTVVTGNCGFSIAPTRPRGPRHRDAGAGERGGHVARRLARRHPVDVRTDTKAGQRKGRSQ